MRRYYLGCLLITLLALGGCTSIAPDNPSKIRHEEEARFRAECWPNDEYDKRMAWSPAKAFKFQCQHSPNKGQ